MFLLNQCISLSGNRDTFAIVHASPPYRDLVIDFGCTGDEKYSEFVAVIVDQVKTLTERIIPVHFNNKYVFIYLSIIYLCIYLSIYHLSIYLSV